MNMRKTRSASIIIFIGTALVLSAGPSHAESLSDFYQNKVIHIVVGYGSGNDYDLDARMVGRHIGGHIPGHPTVTLQNMPGAGTRKAANWVYRIAPKDGTAMGVFSQNLPMDQVLDQRNVDFDVRKFNWIGTPTHHNNVFFVWHTTGVKSLADARRKPLVIGAGAGGNTPAVIYPWVAASFFGAKFKVVSGYRPQEAWLAVERQEVAGLGSRSWVSIKRDKPNWIRDRKINVLFQIGMEKDPELPDIPLFTELAETDDQRRVLEFISASVALGRPFAAAPGVPAEKVAALRAAFDATMNDPKFLAEAGRSQLLVRPQSGEQLGSLVERIVGVSPSAVALLKDALKVKPGKRKKAGTVK